MIQLSICLPTRNRQKYCIETIRSIAASDATDFEVIEAHGEGPRGMWCAAASYAEARGIHRDQRLYVKRARGPSVSVAGETGVVFTTDGSEVAGTAHRSYSVSVREKGLNLPIHHASQFCIDYLIEPQDHL